MINASRNAITSFSIEMHSIQVSIDHNCTDYEPIRVRDVLQCIEALFDIWRVIGSERQDEWCERSHKQQSVSIERAPKSDTATELPSTLIDEQ